MLPIHLISVLFGLSVTTAVGRLVFATGITPIALFMCLYLVMYRTKVYLDDLVYYRNLKRHAVGGGDPIVGFFSWLLWIATAFHITNAKVYFLLTAVTFGLGIVWILLAKRNMRRRTGEDPQGVVGPTKAAHRRWLWFNVIPTVVSGWYALMLFGGVTVDWTIWYFWVGPALLLAGLIIDVALDYRYMIGFLPEEG